MPTPTEVADALYTVLLKNSKGEFPSDEAYQSMMEYAFGHIHLIRQMPEKQRITCLWHLVELGGIPLMIHTLQPGEKAFSMGMTLMGIMFRDENLLSHKMGRLVLKNPRFLPAIERGLTPETDEMMPFLVAQVLHNILRSAAGTQIKDVAKHGKIVKLLRDLTVRSIEEAAKSDWRLVFVTIDILMLMEVANAHDELKDQDIMGLFMDTFAHDDFVSMMKEHGTLLQRVLGVYLLWLVRTRHNKDTEDVELRRAIFAKLPEFKECIPEEELAVKDAEKLSHAERTAASLGNVYRSIEGLSREEETTALAIHLTLKSRVRNWDQVEKEAEGKVRSPDFKKQFEEQKLEVKQAGQQTEEGAMLTTLLAKIKTHRSKKHTIRQLRPQNNRHPKRARHPMTPLLCLMTSRLRWRNSRIKATPSFEPRCTMMQLSYTPQHWKSTNHTKAMPTSKSRRLSFWAIEQSVICGGKNILRF
eukprot:TRINITY_DN7638_c0_g1_i4.p1 TRINITY_DN7638_c0_g1~~TRINITY_DN7638_c0_g1_i4.p1  ORF type:complete len:472 (+),score=62.09 TRINITY_DN7638_c0_g1_i4:62-1477(+)